MAREHVAIVSPAVGLALLLGRKRIETRFYRQRRVPCGRISRGDVVHFKLSGGGLLASAQVSAIKEFAQLTPSQVDRLRRAHARRVAAPAGYWTARRGCRYGVLIWLGPLAAPPVGLAVPRQFGRGWLVLGE